MIALTLDLSRVNIRLAKRNALPAEGVKSWGIGELSARIRPSRKHRRSRGTAKRSPGRMLKTNHPS